MHNILVLVVSPEPLERLVVLLHTVVRRGPLGESATYIGHKSCASKFYEPPLALKGTVHGHLN
jgi:hypothetical protein